MTAPRGRSGRRPLLACPSHLVLSRCSPLASLGPFTAVLLDRNQLPGRTVPSPLAVSGAGSVGVQEVPGGWRSCFSLHLPLHGYVP